MICVMIGSFKFHSIAEAHQFLAEGGNGNFAPLMWGCHGEFLIKIV
jgi:hypothetical protein